MKQSLTVSIVIPARNAADTLPVLFSSLVAGHDKPEEIIVVDDASRDDTAAVCHAAGVRCLTLPENRGPAAARNTGARSVSGDILLFLDADVAVMADTIAICRTVFADPAVRVLVGVYDLTPLNPGLFADYKALHIHTFISSDTTTDSLEGFCCAIRRDVFVTSGGFAEWLRTASIEDLEYGHRLLRNGPLHFSRALRVRHRFPGFWRNARLYFTRTCASTVYGLQVRYPMGESSFLLPGIGSLAAAALCCLFPALAFSVLRPYVLLLLLLPAGGLFLLGSWRLLANIIRHKGWGWLLAVLPLHFGSYAAIGFGMLAGFFAFFCGRRILLPATETHSTRLQQ